MKRKITILTLPDDTEAFSAPFEEDYALLLVVASPVVSDELRARVTSEIVASRCQYALTFGHDCELWHDTIDGACCDDGIPEDRFLMTTWHPKEPIEDVIDFLWLHTSYGTFVSEKLAVVLIGEDEGLEQAIRTRLADLQKEQPSGNSL